MKKSNKIILIVIIAVLALALLGFVMLFLSGNQITIARCIVTENGSLYMVYDERPVHISAGDEKDYQTGDKLLIIHASAFAESYPEQARTIFVMKIGSGTKDDEDYGLGNLFGEDDEDDSLGLEDLFNEGVAGSTEEDA